MNTYFVLIANKLSNTADDFITAELRRVTRKVTQSYLLNLSILSGSLRLLSCTLRLNSYTRQNAN
jgi:hypothetical protein